MKDGGKTMFDTLLDFMKRPDSWTILFGFLGTAGAAAGTYLVKKLGWKPSLSLKPAPPAIDSSEINELIEKKLKEATQSKDYDTLKEKHFQLQALFDVSKSQWEEKIGELTAENEQLKATLAKLERQ